MQQLATGKQLVLPSVDGLKVNDTKKLCSSKTDEIDSKKRHIQTEAEEEYKLALTEVWVLPRVDDCLVIAFLLLPFSGFKEYQASPCLRITQARVRL